MGIGVYLHIFKGIATLCRAAWCGSVERSNEKDDDILLLQIVLLWALLLFLIVALTNCHDVR